jgi:hypothetical protein
MSLDECGRGVLVLLLRRRLHLVGALAAYPSSLAPLAVVCCAVVRTASSGLVYFVSTRR